ncbi:LLM class flavin-dependent oxidoreductase [Paraburkholderia fungorum]|jgi:alkanesulfonate monooxygenase SsuD/methylene tetrahydromethanopterin reductase-like flavin-dependent oxidoreductase (luciferase family)|uniref:LLM class flavin-dependent oxidoreductase n=1 Tax=Paraburkholderia fungorum TaxID=134537 RepID=A0AAP5QHS1_9BURK|nr:LLM class flavin-dependent oxidoreductase [Paraburkholderia fungorum]MBU7436241.1 LLM class flavin-dependent oxidoreductase [Paraburkholderia fungorum]MDT8843708.1 LLM class flavin-dependent oxidoreductase [Paraburkholderia fungorum]PZR45629.1 MAG: LLM class flavin-dependent oxidoreductase [Paraburkholderia fungorum]
MKILAFEQLGYRHLNSDYSQKYDSVTTMPYKKLVDNKLMHQDHMHYLDEMMHAARSGFDGLAMTEHEQASYDVLPNPNLQMSALAYNTQREGLDVALACVGRSLAKSREPLRIAAEYSVLDQISAGRLIAGFPVGLSYDVNRNNGIPPIETRARYYENLSLIKKAWEADDVFSWNGKFGKYPEVNVWPRPFQKKPPVWAPAIGNPNTLAGIIDNDDAFLYLSWFGPKLTGQRVFDRYWDMAEERGKDRNPYRLAFVQGVFVGETDAEAHREYGPHVEFGYRSGLGSIPMQSLGLPGYVDIKGVEFILKDPGDFGIVPKMRTIEYKELVEQQCAIVGDADTVTQQLEEMIKNFGIGHLVIMVQIGSMPHSLVMKNIDLLSQRVLPKLRGIWEDKQWENHWWPSGALR